MPIVLIQITVAIVGIVFYFYYAGKYWWLKRTGKEADQSKLEKYKSNYYAACYLTLFGSLILAILIKIFHLKG